MKKMMEAGLVLAALFAFLVSSAFAAEPLANSKKESVLIGPAYQHTALDTTGGKLDGNEYGIKCSWIPSDAGFTAHVSVSRANLKGSYEDFDNSIEGGLPVVTLEASQRIAKYAGIYAKYSRYFGEIKGGENGTFQGFDSSNNLVTGSWSDKTTLSNLQVMEAGLLVQGDFSKVSVYAGPMLQAIKADLDYSYSDSDENTWSDQTKVVAKSGLGAVAGMVVKLSDVLSAQVGATFKEHVTVAAGLSFAFKP